MQMDAGLDTGPMLLKEAVPIDANVTTAELTGTLGAVGARLIVAALSNVDTLVASPQPEAGVTYASKIDKAEAWLDWTLAADVLARKVRAFDPFPVASTLLRDTLVKLWRASAEPGRDASAPGTVIAADERGVTIACGDGALRVVELQRAGGKRLGAREFLAGFPIHPGDRCGSPRPV
jgi:methionyl-tRNA formyltransferase